MQIDQIPLDRLSVSKANMRQGKKPPDIADILPSVIRRGVISPLFVRPNCTDGHFEIVAGKRRYFASLEAVKQGQDDVTLPCIVLADGDDADALEVSMIENMLRQAPDPVTQWESYTRLVKEGRSVDDIAATFALTELQVKRILALGNLLPRIREAYRAEEIDAETIRHLTLATKAQQKAWLALFDSEDSYAPRGSQLKAWLFGGGAISVKAALFDMADYSGQIVTNLFEEDGYFADSDAFWAAQQAEIEKRKATYLEDGWSAVEIVPPQSHFSTWEYEKAPKRMGGRVYIVVNHRGEVTFHEGYVTSKEGQRLRKAEAEGKDVSALPKMARPELTSTLTSYVDLHRHAAVRNELASHPSVALRVMVAHVIAGSTLWKVEVQDQHTRSDSVNESIETCVAEAQFDERRRAVIACLGLDPERATVTNSAYARSSIGPLVERLLELPELVVMEVAAVVMAETLASGSDLIETLGIHLSVDMARYWTADAAFYDLLRDREVATAILAEVGGEAVASANAAEKGKTIKGVIADCLTGENGRAKHECWVPRWMAFPPSAYTTRGGVATVKAAERARWIAEQERPDEQDPDAPASAAALPADAGDTETVAAHVPEVEDERLAA
jgi:ParB family transcriptional regulator, chromosome partitioning protein